MKAQQQVITSMQTSDIVVFFLAMVIVCTLVGKGFYSLSYPEQDSIFQTGKKVCHVEK